MASIDFDYRVARMLDSNLILRGTTEELRRADTPAPLKVAERALRRAEETGSERAIQEFVAASLGWIHEVTATIFGDLSSAAPLPESLTILIDQAVLQAPFTTWHHLYPGHSLLVAFAAHLRDVAVQCGIDVKPLRLPTRPATYSRVAPSKPAKSASDKTSGQRPIVDLRALADRVAAAPRSSVREVRRIAQPVLFRLIADELARRESSAGAIDEICSTFDVSLAQFARLFTVSRQAAQQWRDNGIPPARAADVDRVRELAGILRRRVLPGRVPQVVRTAARGLDGRTVLDVLETDGADPVYRYLYDLFSYRARPGELARTAATEDLGERGGQA